MINTPTRPDPLAKVTFRGKVMDRKTAALLAIAEQRLGYELTVVQGPYSTAVSASGGTHDGGGVFDLAPFDWKRKVIVLRDLGCFAYRRKPEEGPWAEHVHAGIIDHQDLSPAAQRQQADYLHDPPLNALANHAPDTFLYHPVVEPFNYAKAWHDELLVQRIAGLTARRKQVADRISALKHRITYPRPGI